MTLDAAFAVQPDFVRANVRVHPLAEAGESRCSEKGATKG